MPSFRNLAFADWRSLVRRDHPALALAEPALRRVVPVLLISFLLILGIASGALLFEQRSFIQADALQDMKVGVSLVRAEWNSAERTERLDPKSEAEALLTSTVPPELLTGGRFGLITDAEGTVVAVTPGREALVGAKADVILAGIQPLLMFGERAGVLETQFGGEPALVSTSRLDGEFGSMVMVQAKSALFARWRHLVSFCATLYAITSLILLVILYAYFCQALRARAADAQLSDTHRRVETALSRGRCGLWDWDLARGRMFWSRSMHEILGMESENGTLSFGQVAELMHPEDGSLIDVARVVASGKVRHLDRTFRMRRSDGAYIWVRARAEVTRNAENEIHLIGVAVDVTEQHALAKSSDEANARLKNAIENISESFVLWDASHRLVSCNEKYQEVFGLANGDVVSGALYETVIGRSRRPIEIRPIPNLNPAAGERVVEAMLADGRWLQISERMTSDGGFVSIGTDVTQLKAHQERLSTSERRLIATINALSVARLDAEAKAKELELLNANYIREKERAEGASRAKTTFLANMSHELRTPLNAIIGFSEIMRDGSFGPIGNDKYVEYAADINASGHYLLKLINDILDMSKIEAGRLLLSKERVDLTEIIGEARKIIEVQAAQKSIRFEMHLADEIALSADRRATKQILLNLLANAVKFTNPGGRVEMRARAVGDRAVVTIADTGIGISRNALKQLGKPFEQVENELTRTHKGTGLGLAIAQSLTELHGGAVRIASEPGRGTVVSLRMPLRTLAAVEDGRAARAA
ncbi:PAS domain-containing sensor histidine kinase [Aureimonas leprariae]|nr:PAS domain-containing sensor histidine kinase [Aureimonas leprariae]